MPLPVRRTADARRENIERITRGYNKAGELGSEEPTQATVEGESA